jgi:carbonic anhydrase
MDGRIQLPIINWLQQKHGIRYVDTVTEPGVDKLFSNTAKMDEIKSKVAISVDKHGSKLILVSGHHDCAGNPVPKSEHITHIQNTMKIIESWNLPVKVIGAWVNENWELETIS